MGIGTPVAVAAHGWGWRYATRHAWAVRGLDLDVAPGERVLLLGASGSGKSTLLAGLAGLLTARMGADQGTGEEEGRLLLDGVPARAAREQAITTGQARTGLLLQDPSAQTVLARCGDDVAFGLENHAVPREEIWPRVEAAVRAVGFPYGLRHPTSRLSGGERQRLALAGVLALRPGLLLLDEPTSMLDPDGARLLRAQVDHVLEATGATCLIVEHRVELWTDLVDRVVVLGSGSGNAAVVAQADPASLVGERARTLADHGIWLPTPRGRTAPGAPSAPAGRTAAGPVALLTARDLAVRRSATGSPAVQDVDVDVTAGRALCVVGPNGSGKTTLALALAGLLVPSAGGVRAGAALDPPRGTPEPHRWHARDLVSRIGTVFQEPQHQFLATTCADELAVGPRRIGLPEPQVQARVGELLDRLRLAHLARANPFTLSGGEQRRLSVATVLATRPRVIVLDEPTFGQDARTWAELVDLLVAERAAGCGIVAVTHDETLVEELADDVLRLGRAARPDPVVAPVVVPVVTVIEA